MPIPKLRTTWHPASLKLAGGIAAGAAFVGIVGSALMPKVHNASVSMNTVQASAVVPQLKSVSPAVTAQLAPVPPAAVAAPAVQERLGRKMLRYTVHHNTFQVVLMSFSEVAGVAIEPRWDAIQNAGVREDVVVDLDLEAMTVGQQLTAILDAAAPGKLQYVISGDQIVVQPRPTQAAAAPAQTTVGTRD